MRQIANPACMAAPCAAPPHLAAPFRATGRSLPLCPVPKGLTCNSALENPRCNATGRQWLALHLPGWMAGATAAGAATRSEDGRVVNVGVRKGRSWVVTD